MNCTIGSSAKIRIVYVFVWFLLILDLYIFIYALVNNNLLLDSLANYKFIFILKGFYVLPFVFLAATFIQKEAAKVNILKIDLNLN